MDLAGAINAVPGAADSLLQVLRTQGADAFPLAMKQVIGVAKVQLAFGWSLFAMSSALVLGGFYLAFKDDDGEAILAGCLTALIPLVPAIILLAEAYVHLASPEWYALEKVRSLLP